MNVEWTERKLDSLTGHKTRTTQYQFDMFSPLEFLLFRWTVHFQIDLDSFAEGMINQVMTNWSRYVEKKKKRGRWRRMRRGGGGASRFSHRQWLIESNHTRPISLPFKRFRSSLQYSWHELVIITAKQVLVVCVCAWRRSRPLSSGIEGTARLCSLTKLEGEYWTSIHISPSCDWSILKERKKRYRIPS